MHLELREVGLGSVLPPTSLAIDTGRVTVQACPTEQGPLVLSLIAGGQMRPSTGKVVPSGHGLRRPGRRLAIVDAPRLSAPDEYVSLRRALEEELTYVGKLATRGRVNRFLAEHDLAAYARTPMTDLPPLVRIVALTEIALLRPGIDGVILTSPDRHGGSAAEYHSFLRGVAARGKAVLVIVGTSAARNLLREFPEDADRIHLAPLEADVPQELLDRIGAADGPDPHPSPNPADPTTPAADTDISTDISTGTADEPRKEQHR